MKNWAWNVDFELDIRILGVDLVESIDKALVFGLDYGTNRQSSLRAFQITTHRIDTTTRRRDIEEKADLDVCIIVEYNASEIE